MAIDLRDWESFHSLFAEEVEFDYSSIGEVAGTLPRILGLGRVEGEYYLSPLSVKSGRTRFRVSSLPSILVFPTVAHVYIVVTTSVDCQEILVLPVIVIAVDMMQFCFLSLEEFQPTVSARMILFSECCC